jgi:hypothetical protein
MYGSRRNIARIALFLLALTPVIFADFHHTETTLKSDPSCPACQVQQSSLTVVAVVPLPNPDMRILDEVKPIRIPEVIETHPVRRSPRAPPQG